MPPKRLAAGTLEAKEELKAVLLADTFAQDFFPVTLERPKALLPLVNACLIDYSLEWLAANRVEEVFVCCCSHADQIKRHVEARWPSTKTFQVTVVVSRSSRSVGDVLRTMDSRGGIGGDFVLLFADTITNLDLQAPLQEHRARRAKDRNAIMTLVLKQLASPSARVRLGADALLVALDPASQRLLRYQEMEQQGRHAKVDAHFWGERDAVQLRGDLVDSQMAVCSPEVLLLFTDNFDYQDVRRDFIPGVLSEEELGNKLHAHVVTGGYAARAASPRAYDAISRDILQRWAFPFVPDTNLLPAQLGGPTSYALERRNVYREQNVGVARDVELQHDVAIGASTQIESSAVIAASVVGRGCRIGKGVVVEGSYLHDGVTVWEGATVRSAMLCQGATVMPGARILPGAIVSFRAVIGKGQTVGPNRRISLCRPGGGESSDSEGAEPSGRGATSDFGASPDDAARGEDQPATALLAAAAAAAAGNSLPGGVAFEEAAVGKGGAGFLWNSLDEDAGGRASLAPPPPWAPESGGSSDEASVATAGDIGSDAMEPTEGAVEIVFKQEVTETVLRCVKDGHNMDNAIVELNGLKIAENKTFADVARYVLSTLLGLCLPSPIGVDAEYRPLFPAAPPASDGELLKRLAKTATDWGRLLRQYLKSREEQVDLLLTLEEFCSEEPPFGPASRGSRFVPVFARVLQLLYDGDFVDEEAFVEWADEKAHGDADEKRFLHLAAPFLDWLKNADEESDQESGSED